MSEESFHMFWGGPFSQWCPSRFNIDGRSFNCAEQYMMWSKATLFGNDEKATQILDSGSPREQKALGRQVSNFDTDRWNQVACYYVYKGNLAKFTQNPDLLQDLLDTYPLTLVEASPYDKIWGIGLDAKDPRAYDRSTWLGTNWLGQVLTDLRNHIDAGQLSIAFGYPSWLKH